MNARRRRASFRGARRRDAPRPRVVGHRMRARRPRPQGQKANAQPTRHSRSRDGPAIAGAKPRRSTSAGASTSTSRSACVGCISRWQATGRPAMFQDKRRSTTTWRSPIARWGSIGARTGWRTGPSKSGDASTIIGNVVNGLTILGGNESCRGNAATARKYLTEIAAAGRLPDAKSDGIWALGNGLALRHDRDSGARRRRRSALSRERIAPGAADAGNQFPDPCSDRSLHSTSAGRASRKRRSRLRAARSTCIAHGNVAAMGAGISPAHVWWWHHQALAAKARPRKRRARCKTPTGCCSKASAR